MKRRIALTLIAAMCIALLTGCSCSHEWVEADCVTAKTCSKCKETEGAALGHSWQEATREEPKTCMNCAETEGECLSLSEAYPEGKLRFADGSFLMNTEDLLELYLLKLHENGYMFEKTNIVEERAEEYKVHYLSDAEGHVIYVAVVTNLETDRICMVSAGVPIDYSDIDEANAMMNAAFIIYEVCHGAFTDEKWEELYEDPEYSIADQGYSVRNICDGLGYVSAVTLDHCEVVAVADLNNVLMQ